MQAFPSLAWPDAIIYNCTAGSFEDLQNATSLASSPIYGPVETVKMTFSWPFLGNTAMMDLVQACSCITRACAWPMKVLKILSNQSLVMDSWFFWVSTAERPKKVFNNYSCYFHKVLQLDDSWQVLFTQSIHRYSSDWVISFIACDKWVVS